MNNKEITKLKLAASKRLLKQILLNLTEEQKLVISDIKHHFKKDTWNLDFAIYQDMLKLDIHKAVLLLHKNKFEPFFDKKTTRLMIRKIK